MRKWVGCIDGPEESPYAGGKFRFKMTLPPDYPYSPPQIRFEAKIYHPNIKSTGDDKHGFGLMCIDILQKGNAWSPTLTIDRVLLSVLSLFTDANPDHLLKKKSRQSTSMTGKISSEQQRSIPESMLWRTDERKVVFLVIVRLVALAVE